MKTATVRWASAILGLATIPIVHAGCDNSHLLGAVDGGAGTGGTQGPSPDAMTPEGGATDVPTSGQDGSIVAESWTGYIENYMFPSGSDAVHISFVTDGAGQVSGFISLGNGTPPPPPTDPNVGYPADLLQQAFDVTSASRSYVAEGFAYSMHAGTFIGGRLRFRQEGGDVWRDWCAIQTPAGTSGRCLPNAGFMISGDHMSCGLYDSATQQYTPVDCGKLALCGGLGSVCRCDTQACTLDENAGSGRTTFDITFDGLRASGSTSGQLGDDRNVHLTKDP